MKSDETIFAEALLITDLAERLAFLERECAGNDERRRNLDELLLANEAAETFLAHPTAAAQFDLDTDRTSALQVRCPHCQTPVELSQDAELDSICCSSCGSEFSLVSDRHMEETLQAGMKIGHFELVEQVGMGGFGAVWKATDTKLARTVAIKFPRNGQFNQQQEKAFLREAQNAAQLNHVGIVPVYEVGREDNTLFIVSEFVAGITLADWLEDQLPSTLEASILVTKIAAALDHAHERNVVHRDLKPGNVMLDDQFEPHLMDFGLARREANDVTVSLEGNILGTPAYMSPEQAAGKGHEADRRSDVYSLGIVLYQLLTGELPFRGNLRMLLQQVIHDEPPSPRKLNSHVSLDLETITLKCLEKEPDRRYQTAGEIRDELQRVIQGEPILARPVSRIERTLRWVGRHRAISALAASVFLALTIGAVVSSYYAVAASRSATNERIASENAKKSEQLAKEREAEAVTQLGKTQLALAEAAYLSGDGKRAVQLLEQCPPTARDTNWHYLSRYADRSRRLPIEDFARGIQADPQAPGMFYVLEMANKGNLHYVDGRTGEVKEHLKLPHTGFARLSISPDGTRLAIIARPKGSFLHIVNTHPLESALMLPFKPAIGGDQALFASDSRTLLVSSWPHSLKIDADTGTVQQLPKDFWFMQCANHSRVAYGVAGSYVIALDIDSGEFLWKVPSEPSVKSIAVSNDDQMLALEHWGFPVIHLLSAAEGQRLCKLSVELAASQPTCIASKKAPYFATLETASNRSMIRFWRFAENDLQPFFTLSSGGENLRHLDWNIEEGIVAAVGQGTWAFSIPEMLSQELPHKVDSACFLTDSKIAIAHGGLKIWDRLTSQRTSLLKNDCNALIRPYNRDVCLSTQLRHDSTNITDYIMELNTESAFEFLKMPFDGMDSFATASGGEYVAAANHLNQLSVQHLSEPSRQKQVLHLKKGSFPSNAVGPLSLHLPAGEPPILLASYSRDIKGKPRRETRVYNLTTGKLQSEVVWPFSVGAMQLDITGKVLCTGGPDGMIRGYDARSLELLFTERCHDRDITALTYRPDGGALATGDASGLIRVWRLKEGCPVDCIREMVSSPEPISSLDFSPSGAALLSVSNSRVRLWDERAKEQALSTLQDKNLEPPATRGKKNARNSE